MRISRLIDSAVGADRLHQNVLVFRSLFAPFFSLPLPLLPEGGFHRKYLIIRHFR